MGATGKFVEPLGQQLMSAGLQSDLFANNVVKLSPGTADTAAGLGYGAIALGVGIGEVLAREGGALANGARNGLNAADGVSGAYRANAPWLSTGEVSNYAPGGTFLQCLEGSCVSAAGQNLTNGAVTEAQMLAKINEWANPEKLAAALNSDNVMGGGWIGGMVSEANVLRLANSGRIGVTCRPQGCQAIWLRSSPLLARQGST